MKFLVILLSLVAVAWATTGQKNGQNEDIKPRLCCMPKTYQVNIGGSEAYEVPGTDVHGLARFVAQYGFNSQQQMAAFRIMNPDTYQLISRLVMDYANQTLYNITGSSCVRSEFKAPPPERCLPADAKFVARYKLGGGRESLEANYWIVKNATLQVEEGISFTRNCYPIGAETTVTMGKVHAFITTGYTDMQHRTDPSLFEVPESCKNKVTVDLIWKHFSDHPHLPKAMFTRL